MRLRLLVSCAVHIAVVSSFSIAHKEILFSKRSQKRSASENIGCIHMESLPGDYTYVSEGGDNVCGLYLIGLADQLVEISFQKFDIDCEKGGLLATVDGWETQGQFFPSDWDSQLSSDERYKTFCGKKIPVKMMIASQNVAMLQFRIPVKGQGFTVSIHFPDNKQPCNVVSMSEEGTLTLRNYGRRINCSVSILFPEAIQLLNIDVGETNEFPTQTKETGLIHQCAKFRSSDFVEFLDGNGLDPSYMWRETDVCGLSSSSGHAPLKMGCQHSVVRMVSSGRYFNSVTFKHRALSELELEAMTGVEC